MAGTSGNGQGLGIDATWIEPHLEDFSAHITEARAAAGLSALGRLRATAMK
jgi:hypothetical protein